MRPVLRGARVLLRPASADDLDALAAVLSEPAVAKYWPGFDRAKVREELVVPHEDVVVLAIEHGGEAIGAIQYGEEDDPMYRHASVDVFLSARFHRRGLGSEAIELVLEHLIDTLGHHRVVIDPAADNAGAIEAYKKLGFRVVGVLREYERGPDGTFHDGVLMDLLANDFIVSRSSRRSAI